MSGTYGKSDAQSIAVIHRALDLGVNLLDSADMYGWGHNEKLDRARAQGAARPRRPRDEVRPGAGRGRRRDLVDGRPAHIVQACDASLRRLGTDEIDLYYQHRVDPKVSIEETVGAMSRAGGAGGRCGASVSPRPRPPPSGGGSRCTRSARCSSSTRSSTGSPAGRGARGRVASWDHTRRVLAPRAAASYSGRIQSQRRRSIPRDDRKQPASRHFQGESFEPQNRRLVGRIEAISQEKGITPSSSPWRRCSCWPRGATS